MTNPLDYSGAPARIDQLKAALTEVRGRRERLGIMAELSWYLRQRDASLAREYFAETQAILRNGEIGYSLSEVNGDFARLHLALAEIEELAGARKSADRALNEAEALFAAVNDPIGLGDLYLT